MNNGINGMLAREISSNGVFNRPQRLNGTGPAPEHDATFTGSNERSSS